MPLYRRTASRRIRRCSASTLHRRPPQRSSMRVEPSTSVKRNVTVPVGRSRRAWPQHSRRSTLRLTLLGFVSGIEIGWCCFLRRTRAASSPRHGQREGRAPSIAAAVVRDGERSGLTPSRPPPTPVPDRLIDEDLHRCPGHAAARRGAAGLDDPLEEHLADAPIRGGDDRRAAVAHRGLASETPGRGGSERRARSAGAVGHRR